MISDILELLRSILRNKQVLSWRDICDIKKAHCAPLIQYDQVDKLMKRERMRGGNIFYPTTDETTRSESR